MRVITLLSDFGAEDYYVGCMKGVILSTCQAEIVDISHEIPKFNVRYGAFVLMQAAPYFPKGTIHVAVIDPGVGTKRNPIVIEGKRHIFIGPDNGVLTLAAAIDGIKSVVKITNKKYALIGPSKTFSGREIFAPAAAHIARGVLVEEFGTKLKKFEALSLPEPTVKGNQIIGEIFVIDSFGNQITNIHSSYIKRVEVGKSVKVETEHSTKFVPFVNTYGDVEKGKAVSLVGSSNFLEIGVNQGNAAKTFKTKPGDLVKITLPRQRFNSNF